MPTWDRDEDVRLVVLRRPYVVDSLANGRIDAFCVGAPWNSVAVDLGIYGHILHFVSDHPGARRGEGAGGSPGLGRQSPGCGRRRSLRAAVKGAEFIEDTAT